jgi:hypothetical protein
MDELSSYLQIGRQERKLFFMDSRYPTLHLTISCGTPHGENVSGEIDIHLTREFPDKTKAHGSIAKLTKESIEGFFRSLLPRLEVEFTSLAEQFLQQIRPLRPGWLRRKGYLIFWIPEEEHMPWLMKFAHRHKKNKFRVYLSSIAKVNHVDEMRRHLYEPSVLHEIAARGQRGLIQALRVTSRKRRHKGIISLTSIPWPDGTIRWIAIDRIAVKFMEMMKSMEDSVFQPLTKSLSVALNEVFDELHLDELGIKRENFTSF